MTRYAHFVGSVPTELMTGDGAVLRWFADSSSGNVTGLPCDLDPDWIMQYLRDRGKHQDAFEIVRGGDYADYSDFPSYGVRRGVRLEPRHVSMDRLERIGAVVTAFDALRETRPDLRDTKLQLSQPNPLDLAMFVFAGAAVSNGFPLGPALRRSNLIVAALRALPVFTQAVLAEIAAVNDRYGDRVVWQVESPFALLGMVKADQLGSRWAAAPLLSRQLSGLLTGIHELGARSVVHLCYGDYQHKSLLSPRSLAPAVTLLNHTAGHLLASGTPLPAVHIPCAYGSAPAPLEPAFYAPLRRLDPEWKIIAGVASPEAEADSAQALRLFEEAAGRTAYGVATACGLGRCNVAEAQRAAATMARLTTEAAAA
ncbi:hypothetical protein [Nocardia macrotermitis]|uniref:Uncharacterized protein n=1 Tax=Nocardia macrotermitis TaxID=2585198 RepID=A0A7K0D446_9NOCA|nr:hypothetical protein [Nocardia macrotermitis]MQY20500.1 hypothetical protein [Nocardia macrotermitis]